MITVVQRVNRAAVRVDGTVVGAIERGALLLVAVEHGDSDDDASATARKIAALRFFEGRTPMDKTLAEVGGACLVVSQFTLAASLHKGNRPAFTAAAAPELAERLYLRVVEELAASGLPTEKGSFGASMAVELENDGPVTFVLRVREGRVL